jgi:hypothetical protein
MKNNDRQKGLFRFFFFFLVTNIALKQTEAYNLSRRKENRRWCKTTTRSRRRKEGGKMGMQPERTLAAAQYAK